MVNRKLLLPLRLVLNVRYIIDHALRKTFPAGYLSEVRLDVR